MYIHKMLRARAFHSLLILIGALVTCLLHTPVIRAGEGKGVEREKYEERILFVGEYGSGTNQLRQILPGAGECVGERLHPPCMSVAPDGTVLIADQFNGFIKRFSVSGEVIQTIPVDTSLPVIQYLSVDANGNIHYLREGSWLVTHDSDGAYIEEVALAAGRPLSVYDMTFAEGEIYVRNWDRELMDYVGLRFNSRGDIEERRSEHPLLWVATAGRYTVVEITEHSYRFCGETMGMAKGETFQKEEDGDLHFSDCLGVDKHDNLYLKEYRDRRRVIVKYNRHSREVAEIRVREVYNPVGVGYQLAWLDSVGNIYALDAIDDYYHWAVYKYSPVTE